MVTDHYVDALQCDESAGHGVSDERAGKFVLHDLHRGQAGALVVWAGFAGVDVIESTDLMQAPHHTYRKRVYAHVG